MAYDRATHVGCAFARYTNNYKTGLFACNYASGNIRGYKIYKCGTAASKCLLGRNPTYPALCNINEPIDPNQVYWKLKRLLSIFITFNIHHHLNTQKMCHCSFSTFSFRWLNKLKKEKIESFWRQEAYIVNVWNISKYQQSEHWGIPNINIRFSFFLVCDKYACTLYNNACSLTLHL